MHHSGDTDYEFFNIVIEFSPVVLEPICTTRIIFDDKDLEGNEEFTIELALIESETLNIVTFTIADNEGTLN